MTATVLCVHAHRARARSHAEILESEGHEALCAQDGRQARALLEVHQPDLIVIDAALPRRDGLEVVAEIRAIEAFRNLPALLLVEGVADEAFANRALSLGALEIEAVPLAAERLLECVASHVKPDPARSSATTRPGLPPSGSLADYAVPELLNAARLTRFDGLIVFENGRKKKAVQIREGWPTAVKSNLVSDCLGHYLSRTGRVSGSALAESAERMRAGEGLQGEILVAMDVLEESALVEALRAHAEEKLLEIFSWVRGGFTVRPGVRIQRASSLGVEGRPDDLIVEGVRRHYPLNRIDRFLEIHSEAHIVPQPLPDASPDAVRLTGPEQGWLAALDGSETLGAISAQPEWVRRVAFGLLSIGLLSAEHEAGEASASREAASRAARAGARDPSPEDETLRAGLAKLANRIRDLDHYGVLDVDPDADDEAIRVAYASLAKQTHPDRFHSASSSVSQLAAQVFTRVAEAYAAIGTAEGRSTYAAEQARGRREDAAEDEGRRALTAETEFQKGEARMAQRDYEGALVHYGSAMQHFPSEGEYRAHYGWCLYLCHPENEVMLGEALEHCREGLRLAKDREKPYLLLGRLYKAMGKTVAAKRMFARAVQIRPQCVEAMRELRIMNMRSDRKSQGLGKVVKRIFRR
jgi:CheY-like chemotaxis protein